MSKVTSVHASAERTALKLNWYQAIGALVLLLVWQAFLYRETAVSMFDIWSRSNTFAHDFLVPPIALWLIWRKRAMLTQLTPTPSVATVIFMGLISFLWLISQWVAVNSLAQIAFVALLVFTVPAVLGLSVTRLILFPLSYMFFAVPIGEFLMPQLMEWTADFTVVALKFSGIPVYREGLHFVIPSGAWSVVEACSGVRYLIASVTVGALFSYLNFKSVKLRIFFVLASFIVPVVANWVRAYLIVLLGHISGNKIAAGVDHLIYGWLFFGLVMTLMFWIAVKFSDVKNPFFIVEESPAKSNLEIKSAVNIFGVSAFLAFVVTVPHWMESTKAQNLQAASYFVELPSTLAPNWRATQAHEMNFKPDFKNVSYETFQTYEAKEGVVGVYLGLYENQNFKKKLVSSENFLTPTLGGRWIQTSVVDKNVIVNKNPFTVRVVSLRESGNIGTPNNSKLLVWLLYWVDGSVTSNDYMVKLLSVYNRFLGREDSAAAIVLYAPVTGDGSTSKLLERFLESNYQFINEQLVRRALKP